MNDGIRSIPVLASASSAISTVLGTAGRIVARSCWLINNISVSCEVVAIVRSKVSLPTLPLEFLQIVALCLNLSLILLLFPIVIFILIFIVIFIVILFLFFPFRLFLQLACFLFCCLSGSLRFVMKLLPLGNDILLVFLSLTFRASLKALLTNEILVQSRVSIAGSASIDIFGHTVHASLKIFVTRSVKWVIIATLSTVPAFDAHAVKWHVTNWTILPRMHYPTVDILWCPSLDCLLFRLHPWFRL